jgi:integral membrane protein
MGAMSPRILFRRFAAAEMVTWGLLLLGMALKYLTRTTDVGVQVFGLLHGVVFLGYLLVALALWVDQPWSLRTAALAVAAAVPPFLTVWAERRMEREGALADHWRLGSGAPARTLPERVVQWGVRRPAYALAVGTVAVLGATAVLLWVGPPVSSSQG